MLTHALLLLLFFNHGFILIKRDILVFLIFSCFCFLGNKYYSSELMLLTFRDHKMPFLCKQILFMMENIRNEMISYKITDRQYYEYCEWTDRYYEWTDGYYEWANKYYEQTNEWAATATEINISNWSVFKKYLWRSLKDSFLFSFRLS